MRFAQNEKKILLVIKIKVVYLHYQSNRNFGCTFRTFGRISEFGIGRKRRLPGMWRRNGSYRRRL